MPEQIGFIGLGSMGEPIAANLISAGYKLKVYNRTASKARPLAERGAEVVTNPALVANSGGIVATMVADDVALEQLTLGTDTIAHRLAPGGIHLSMSTIAPSTARRLAQYHADLGSMFVAAPVFGRPDAAAARRLVVAVSGPKEARERMKPLFEAVGRQTFDFGDDPGAALVTKVSGNFLIAAAMESIAEALAMAEKSGVDPIKVAELITSTLFACPVYQIYGTAIAHRRHTPAGFRLKLGLKDVNLALKNAEQVASPMPVGSVVRDRFLSSIARGREEMDWSAIALAVRDDAGLKN